MANQVILPIDTSLIAQAFVKPQGVQELFGLIKTEAQSHVLDVETKKGREFVASLAYKVSQSKTAVDNHGKSLVEGIKSQAKVIDEGRKFFRDSCDELRSELRAPLQAWEQKEAARIDRLKERLEYLTDLGRVDQLSPSEFITDVLSEVKATAIDDSWQEFLTDAAKAKDIAVNHLEKLLDLATQREAEQAELARLREEAEARAKAEREQRIADEAAARAKAQAEAQAKAQREALEAEKAELERQAELSAQREAQAKVQAERAAQDALEREAKAKAQAQAEAEQAAKAAAERESRAKADADARVKAEEARVRTEIEAQAKAEEAEKAKREANLKHRRAVNRAAVAALVASAAITEEQAQEVIKAIHGGLIPRVSISY